MTDRLRSIEDHLLLIEPNWDVNVYWAVLSQVDIDIAVLKPSPMADCKSEIKWLEAAMFAVPSVVSDTGFLCRTPADWTATLGRLVTAIWEDERSINLFPRIQARTRLKPH